MSSFPMNNNQNVGKCGCASRRPQHSHSHCCSDSKPQNTCTITFRHTGESRVWRPDTGCNQCRNSNHQHRKHHSCGCNFGF